MEHASIMQNLPFKKDPRDGQKQVLGKLDGRTLNVQLPTGYGKTFTACAAYSILAKEGRVNRLLFIVPTTAQLDQFVCDGHDDLEDAAVEGSHVVTDISFFRATALKKHRENKSQVYATTVQALCGGGIDIVGKLFETGRWMVVVDEYHHYGSDKSWTRAVEALNYEFRLAMSATPHRKNNDSAFGSPDVIVEYRKAVEEKAVKPLVAHSYVYRIDLIGEDQEVVSYTTSELADDWGIDPASIEKKTIERKMRWSPKYISPLVSIPLERMQVESLYSGHKLQAIIGAMCVSHAEMVCSQVKAMFPELSVDWVGTGDDGRSKEDNKRVLNDFCPSKDEHGSRKHSLDVLVHVGMAGEGLDSINVSEVIHLNPASINNSNNQENGRAARYIEGVTGNINFDSCAGYAKEGYVGSAIMDAMDFSDPQDPDESDQPSEHSDDIRELPDDPAPQIHDMEVIDINSGGVQRMKKMIAEAREFKEFTVADLDNPDSGLNDFALQLYRNMRKLEAEEHNEKSVVMQWKDSVNKAISIVTGRTIKMMESGRVNKGMAGDVKKRINGRKKRDLGAITEDVSVCKQHYQWIKNLEQELINSGIPSWLV